jgi:hydroxymethylbilane synthase
MPTRTLRLATRGSDLALRQAASVQEALEDRRYEVELVEVETEGDRVTDELIHRLGKTGAFVRALDERVMEGDVDAAVHSLKDMPTDHPDGLVVVGVLERAPANDVLVTPEGKTLDELPEGATVGTSSLRRRAQLLNARADLTVEPLRGNVDTRVEKVLAPSLQAEHEARVEADKERKGHAGDDDYEAEYDQRPEEWFDALSELERNALGREVDVEYDAIVLAEAGLRRSGLDHHVPFSPLSTKEFVPAPGQGAIAVTATENIDDLNEVLDFPRTRVETTVERTLLKELGGGCIAPIGAYAILQGSYVHVTVQVFGPDGEDVIEASRDLPVEQHGTAAAEFAADLRDRGAAELIDRAKEAAE